VDDDARMYHCRDDDGAEVDLILQTATDVSSGLSPRSMCVHRRLIGAR